MAGVALVETLRGLGAHAAGLKWPNDIVCAERGVSSGPPTWRKLGGILAEGLVRDGTLAGIVLGVGVNLLEWPVPPGLCQQVTWLAREADRRVERGSLVALVEQHLRRGFSALAERGGEDRLIEWWSRYAVGLRGAPVAISDGRTGLTAGIDATGALLVDDPDGARHRIAAGPVTWLDSDPS
jgi:BirA family biotin operon repressor/biotin-[acetyl-CoA-carboxylase] ligase